MAKASHLGDDCATTVGARDQESNLALNECQSCPLAKVSIDPVVRKGNRCTSFGTLNACPILGSDLFCAPTDAVERCTMTEVSVCLDSEPKASPGGATRIEGRLNELSEFSGDDRPRM
jgi:hypothetical protein